MNLNGFFDMVSSSPKNEDELLSDNKLEVLKESNFFKLLMFGKYNDNPNDKILFSLKIQGIPINDKVKDSVNDFVINRKLYYLKDINFNNPLINTEIAEDFNFNKEIPKLLKYLYAFLEEMEEVEDYESCSLIFKTLNKLKSEMDEEELRGFKKNSL